jgi:hypothetical protein
MITFKSTHFLRLVAGRKLIDCQSPVICWSHTHNRLQIELASFFPLIIRAPPLRRFLLNSNLTCTPQCQPAINGNVVRPQHVTKYYWYSSLHSHTTKFLDYLKDLLASQEGLFSVVLVNSTVLGFYNLTAHVLLAKDF